MITRKTLWASIIISMIIGGIAGFEIDRSNFKQKESHLGRNAYIKVMTKELGLTTTQQGQLDSILVLVHPKFQAIRKTFNVQMHGQIDTTQRMIMTILSPEQRETLAAINAKNDSGSVKQ